MSLGVEETHFWGALEPETYLVTPELPAPLQWVPTVGPALDLILMASLGTCGPQGLGVHWVCSGGRGPGWRAGACSVFTLLPASGKLSINLHFQGHNQC